MYCNELSEDEKKQLKSFSEQRKRDFMGCGKVRILPFNNPGIPCSEVKVVECCSPIPCCCSGGSEVQRSFVSRVFLSTVRRSNERRRHRGGGGSGRVRGVLAPQVLHLL